MSIWTPKLFQRVVDAYLPDGWTLVFHIHIANALLPPSDDEQGAAGQCNFARKQIDLAVGAPIRDMIHVFLHEVGHATHDHRDPPYLPRWREEYEAEKFAWDALTELGLPIEKSSKDFGRKYVRELIEAEDDDLDIDEEVLKFAYGRDWRKHR